MSIVARTLVAQGQLPLRLREVLASVQHSTAALELLQLVQHHQVPKEQPAAEHLHPKQVERPLEVPQKPVAAAAAAGSIERIAAHRFVVAVVASQPVSGPGLGRSAHSTWPKQQRAPLRWV